METGGGRVDSTSGMLSSVAWRRDGRLSYALEGAIFITGAGLQWLRDGLGIIGSASEAGPPASSIADSRGAFIVPAVLRLGAPHLEPQSRGHHVGLTRGNRRSHAGWAGVPAMDYHT